MFENNSSSFQEQLLNLKLLCLLFSMKSHLKYFIKAKRLTFKAKDQWTVGMATKKPFGKGKKNAVKSVLIFNFNPFTSGSQNEI